MSPSVYGLAFQLGIPVVQYLHNYRISCANGYFLNHGEACTSCIHGNFSKAALTGCWRDSRLVSGWMGLVLTRLRSMGVLSKVSAWIALSKAQCQLHIEMGIPAERIHILPHFFVPRAELYIEELGQDVLFVGRLSKEKGVAQLLDAWKLVRRGDTKLLLMGDGPERAPLERKVATEAIQGVEFLGFVPNEDQGTVWRRAALSVVPSIWQEPLGLVVYEAWERGRPVIVSKAGGLDDSVEEGVDGFKVPMGDSVKWSEAISCLLADKVRSAAMRKAGLEKLRNGYRPEAWLQQFSEVLDKVCV